MTPFQGLRAALLHAPSIKAVVDCHDYTRCLVKVASHHSKGLRTWGVCVASADSCRCLPGPSSDAALPPPVLPARNGITSSSYLNGVLPRAFCAISTSLRPACSLWSTVLLAIYRRHALNHIGY
eukprot:GHUV01044947.1.p1 GENE.GHUV01044947.1~~GHUV01044947.1.p1  ORF type:complete len:124 (+),score=8.62 GHUV01044947.1:226-597(+)